MDDSSLHKKPYFLFPNVSKRWFLQKNGADKWYFLYYQERWNFFFPKISSYSLNGKWKIIFFKKMHGNTIFFSNNLKRWSFQKNRFGIWSFLLYWWYFIFLKNMILFFRWKMKSDLSQKKIHGTIIFFSNAPKRWYLQKNCVGIWSFLYYLERWYFFPRKIWCFFFGRKTKDDLSQEIHANMMFSVYMYKCYKHDITLLQKKSKKIFSQKNTLKGDWHSRLYPRKSSDDSVYFCGDLHRRFHILLSSEKKQET